MKKLSLTILTITILQSTNAANANTSFDNDIKVAINKHQEIENLTHKLQVAKLQRDLSKIKKSCEENGGCGNKNINSIVTPALSNNTNNIGVNEVVDSQKESDNYFLEKQLNTLQIKSIINKNVIFKGIIGSYGVGDNILDSKNIVVSQIYSDKIILQTKNGTKVISIRWGN
jgi:hypothetical protein